MWNMQVLLCVAIAILAVLPLSTDCAPGLSRAKRAPLPSAVASNSPATVATGAAAVAKLDEPDGKPSDPVIASIVLQSEARDADADAQPESAQANSAVPLQGSLKPPIILKNRDEAPNPDDAAQASQHDQTNDPVPSVPLVETDSLSTESAENADASPGDPAGLGSLAPSIDLAPGTELEIPAPQTASLAPGAILSTSRRLVAKDSMSSVEEQFPRPFGIGISNATAPRRNLVARDTVPAVNATGLGSSPFVCSRGATTGTYMAVWSPASNYSYYDNPFGVCDSLGLTVASITTANAIELTAVARSCGAKTAAWITTVFQDVRILGTGGTGNVGSLNYNYWGAGAWPVICALPVANTCASTRAPTAISFDNIVMTADNTTGIKQFRPSISQTAFQTATGLNITAVKSNGIPVGDSVIVDGTTVPSLYGSQQPGLTDAIVSPNAYLALFGSYITSAKAGAAFDLNYLYVTGVFGNTDRLVLSEVNLNADGSVKNVTRSLDFTVPARKASLLRVGWTGIKVLHFPEYVAVDHIIGCL
ncbi:hypothetical protein BDZ88DRAFT_433550 [Geranomyces variabilis]|nr:hypothetical protein BDZ88DRAFT_433550 [Geranomyces variabilis]KAJ3131715.1 hypothetical protein HDU90_008097 [Geranomyces variabilis]